MAEFRSVPEPKRSLTPVYALLVFLIGLVVVFYYAQTQEQTTQSEPIPVPGMVRPGEPNFEYYKNRIRLANVHAVLGINYAKSRIAIVEGTIINEGDRKLEAVELSLALYDIYEKITVTRIKTPLRPGIGVKRPMNPLEKRSFTVWIEPIEQLWNPKRVDIEITGLKYQ